jgi:uncharacterized membrane protein
MRMSWPYLHTLVNHFPIVLTVIGALAVLVAAMVPRRATWVYALSTLTLAGITVYPAWWSGHRAARAVHDAWYIQRGAVPAHSAAADITVWIVGVVGLLALLALMTMVRTREAVSPARALRVIVGLGALVSICAVSYTGYLGGKIVVESPILASPTPPPAITAPAPNATPAPATTTPSPTAKPATPDSTHPTVNPSVNPSATPPSQTTPAPQSRTP